MALSENIKTRRKALKMSQEYVAEQLDISRQAVAKWEAGKSEPTTENLVKLAALFEMSVSELVEPENIAEAEAARQEQECERQHNARMLSGRFFAYIFVDAGAMGYFRLYPNDSPGWWWTLIFVCGAVGLFITSRDMHKRHKMTKNQISVGAGFLVAVLFLPRWLPFSVGWNWLVASLVAAACIIYLNLKYWRYIWPVKKA